MLKCTCPPDLITYTKNIPNEIIKNSKFVTMYLCVIAAKLLNVMHI